MPDYLADPTPDMIQQALAARLKQYAASGLTPEGKMQPDQPTNTGPQGNDMMRGVGGLMSLLGPGNKGMGEAGQRIQEAAQQQALFQRQQPMVEAQTQLEQTKARGAQLEQEAGQSPGLATARSTLMGKQGFTPPAGMSPSALSILMPEVEKQYGEQTKRQMVPKFVPVPPGSGTLDVHTGKTTGGGIESLMTPEAIDQSARAYLKQGPSALPSMGRANPVIHGLIIKRAAELDPGGDLTANKATTKADTGSLVSQQKILDNAEGWERTGKANLGVMLNVAQKLSDTGSPWLNEPVRRFLEKATGDPNMTAFRAAHATVVNEYAKILSGAQGSGSVTEGARHEAESMLPLDATWDQLSAAAKVLDTDAGNRINSARQQVGQIKGRMGGQQQSAPAETAPAATAPRRRKYNPATGGLE